MQHMDDFPDRPRDGFSSPQAAMSNFLGEEMKMDDQAAMAAIPIWIDALLQSGSARDDFMRHLIELENKNLRAVSDAVKMGDMVKAQVKSGRGSAYFDLRYMLEAYEREREQQLKQHDDARRG